MRFDRQTIRNRLNEKREKREPIVIGGAGIGLVAKIADRAGIDLIMGYNTGPFRMDGHGSLSGYLAYGDSNQMTLDLGEHLLKVIKDTPLIGGIGAADPYRDIDRLIDQMMAMGFSGITNVPTTGLYDGEFRKQIDATNLGYPEEVELVRKCNDKDIFTAVYAFSPEEAVAMAEAGADLIGAHVGLTLGGTIGAGSAKSLDEACKRTQSILEAAKKINPDILVVCHGGPFDYPENVQYCFDRTDVDGFIGASSVERLPVERAIKECIEEFRSLKLR
uniref:phosphoenolpyruvate hydrolase family protein n=1 Tax=Vaginimicrobium propionicum TaxID=1871034 RepID=UPI000970F4E9|nr:phosphoenolpyruvate hydrolase family protein [Vaginimicrobium propionicum]